MPEWLTQILPFLAAAVGGGTLGALVTGIVTAKRDTRADRDALVDQLQEERKTYVEQLSKERAEQAAEREAYTKRLDQMWADKAMSREHVAALRDHIWQRKPPPPPEPPAGYIH